MFPDFICFKECGLLSVARDVFRKAAKELADAGRLPLGRAGCAAWRAGPCAGSPPRARGTSGTIHAHGIAWIASRQYAISDSADPMNVALWLERAARVDPARVAIFRGVDPWATYGELALRVARRAAGLRARVGLARGARVALVMINAPEYLEALYAVWWAGLVAVPVNAKLHPREVAFIVENAGARLVLDDPAQLAGMAGPEPLPCTEMAPADLAWLFYTSGTTGRPKGAMLSHRNLVQMTLGYFCDVDGVERDGRLLHAAPMSHGSGLYTFTHLAKGAAQVVPESGGFDAAEALDLMNGHDAVSMFAAPTMVKRLVDEGRGARGLKTLVYGGGPMYAADLHAATEVFGNRLVQIYGQGESPMTITALSKFHHGDAAHPRHAERLASVGVPQGVVEVSLRDAHGCALAAGEVGEICVRGDVVMSGYWANPAATAQALRDGWLWTGDLGAFDADGFLTLKDRSKDLIVSGGSNIYPREVEEVLLAHPAVAEACVVGRPDPEWGETVVAFIVARGERPDAAELDRLCLDHIARFKRPREYRFVEQLPKNHYGKVVKAELRATLG
jgi:long-chain acyl-CoA synthetase